MTPERFNQIVNEQKHLCNEILIDRANMYSKNNDRLWNFKVSGLHQDITPEKALRGMMDKQVVALYDYIDDIDKEGANEWFWHSRDQWLEKITDCINYLYLLRALLEDMGRF